MRNIAGRTMKSLLRDLTLLTCATLAACAAIAADPQPLKYPVVVRLLLDETGEPFAGARLKGSCRAKSGIFGTSITSNYSCEADEAGICQFEVESFTDSSGKVLPCAATDDWTIITYADGTNELVSKLTYFSKPHEPGVLVTLRRPAQNWNGMVVTLTRDEAEFRKDHSRLTKEFFADNISLKDDELETSATFTSRAAHQHQRAGNHGYASLRIFVDKKTLKTVAQVYVDYSYRDNRARSLAIAKYLTPAGPESAQVTRISSEVDCSSRIGSECRFFETIGFDIPYPLLQSLAAKHVAEPRGAWRMRVSAHSGDDLNLAMPYGELAAMVERIDSYLATNRK